jgi:hypothetical protein
MQNFINFVEKSEHLAFYIPRLANLAEYKMKSPEEQHINVNDTNFDLSNSNIQLAYSNLNTKFWFVGITELFDQTLFLLASEIGFSTLAPWVNFPLKNTPMRPSFFALPITIRQLIEKKAERDVELYELFRSKIEAKFLQTNFGPAFNKYVNLRHLWVKDKMYFD